MGIETFNTINEGVNLSLMLMVNTIVLISLTCATSGLVIYLAGIVALCFEQLLRLLAISNGKPAKVTRSWKSSCEVRYTLSSQRVALAG